MSTVYVTNRWEKPVAFDYAFKPYTFAVGETVEVPVEVANHIFGYGAEDKEPYMARLGLIKTRNDIPDGLKIIAKFEIADTPPSQDRSLSPAVERVPLPPLKGSGGKFRAAHNGA
jgi:hypothetical protein